MYINNPAQGKPIFNGKMYFGEPDLDPEIFTNQKQVYYIQENGDLVAASQPIILSAGGNPTYNGDAVTLSITGEYSTKVLNKLGVQEYYIARTDSSGDSGSVIAYAEVEQILIAGQLDVSFGGITASVANIYVGKKSGDRGKLFLDDDYTITGSSQITLNSSFEAGTKLVATSSELIERVTSIKPMTLAEATSNTAAIEGQIVQITDRADGQFTYLTGQTPNTYNIIETDISGLYLVWREVYPTPLAQYGAVSGEDSTGAIQAAISNEGVINVDGDYIFSSSLAVDRANISIVGSGSLAGANRSAAITYSDLVKSIILKDFTLKTCAGTQTINSLTSAIDYVRMSNVTIDDSEIGIHLLGSVKDAIFTGNTFNNINRTLIDQTCQGIKIGNNDRETSLETKKISITNNHFTSIVNDFDKETHAFIVYGREVVATGNIAEGVTHAAAIACETYYFKADIVTCTGNTVLNQGVSDDGCINFKGGPEGDLAQVTGQRITCTGNTIVNEDLSLSVIGISCTDEKATITGNTLVNTWFRAFSGDDILFADNSIYIERSTGSITWFEVENANNVTIRGNTVHVVANNFDVDTAQAARVRTSASVVNNFRMIDNNIRLEYPDLTMGANTVASLQLWAENFDITNFDVRDNKLELILPNIASDLNKQMVALSGTNAIDGKIRRNEADLDLIYFDDNDWVNRETEFSGNDVNDVLMTTTDKGFEQKVSDVVVRMPGANANRTVFLPQARSGLSMKLLNDSPTYTMTMTIDATAPTDTFVDGTTSKVLSVGASASLRCFTADVWVIESQSGVIT